MSNLSKVVVVFVVILLLLTPLNVAPKLWADEIPEPEAVAQTSPVVVNLASNAPGPLAPYTLATIYGKNLAYTTRWITPGDIAGNRLPETLDGVRVWVAGWAAPLYLVTPEQINFLVPYDVGFSFPTEVNIVVAVDARVAANVRIPLHEAAPAFFLQQDNRTVDATHANWDPITPESPARPGEIIVLFVGGLGRTNPSMDGRNLPTAAAQIQRVEALRVLLDGQPVSSDRIEYAGVTPFYAGLYQINLRMPEINIGENQEIEIQVAVGDEISPHGVFLPFASLQ